MKCGHCDNDHREAATVRACSEGRTFTCTWLVRKPGGEWNDWEPYTAECGATAVDDERGFHCEAGHDHVNAETRYDEGWDYASDEQEAAVRAKYGHASVLPDGTPYRG